MGKKLPQKPSDLWKAKKTFMSPAEMHRHMKEAVAEQRKQISDMERRSGGERHPNGKTMRDFRGTEK